MTDTTSLCLNVKTGGAIVIDGRIWVMVIAREPRTVMLKVTTAESAHDFGLMMLTPIRSQPSRV